MEYYMPELPYSTTGHLAISICLTLQVAITTLLYVGQWMYLQATLDISGNIDMLLDGAFLSFIAVPLLALLVNSFFCSCSCRSSSLRVLPILIIPLFGLLFISLILLNVFQIPGIDFWICGEKQEIDLAGDCRDQLRGFQIWRFSSLALSVIQALISLLLVYRNSELKEFY